MEQIFCVHKGHNKTKDMEKMKDMENRNNDKNQKTVKTDKTDSAFFSESLKCLKSLMQIFIESAKSAKSAKSIFATFATFASAIFVGKASCESTVRYRVKSRIPSCLFRYSLDSILSRFSLASLICLCMLTVGVGNAWGTDITYTFASKEWTANSGGSPANWTSNADGSSFESTGSARGVANNGVNGSCTSPTSFSGVTSIEIIASSNKDDGKIKVLIGSTEIAEKTISNSNDATYTYNSSDYSLIASLSDYVRINVTAPSGSKTLWIKSVTITYVTEKFTVTFDEGSGSCETSSYTQATIGESLTLPTADPSSDCESHGWEFAGWKKTSAVMSETTTAPTLYTGTYVPLETETLYAVYKLVDGTTTYFSNPDCTYDYFYDIMHGNEIDAKQGTYAMPAAPDDATPGDDYCGEKHFHFIGWLEEQYINDDGTLKDGGAAYIIPAGETGHTANNKNYYAIWSKVEEE